MEKNDSPGPPTAATTASFRPESGGLGKTQKEAALIHRARRRAHGLFFAFVVVTLFSATLTFRHFEQESFRGRCLSTYNACAERCGYFGTMGYLGRVRPKRPWRVGDWPQFSQLCLESCVLKNQCPDLPAEHRRKMEGKSGLLDRRLF
jgi:hypothetical protein